MVKKDIYTLILVGFLTHISLNAMDMDRVNALAQQIKSGQNIALPLPDIKATATKTPTEVATKPVAESIPEEVTTIAGTVTEESLGLRKTNLYVEQDDTAGEITDYSKVEAGKSEKFERAFENAPPMIPHNTDGMLPIKIGNNACTGCHLPEVAADMKATPIPASHFASFRPNTAIGADGRITKEGAGVNNTSDFKTVIHKLTKLSSARFNCTQCHAPQSTQAPLVGNTFTPDFSKNGAKKSNLIDVINDGVE